MTHCGCDKRRVCVCVCVWCQGGEPCSVRTHTGTHSLLLSALLLIEKGKSVVGKRLPKGRRCFLNKRLRLFVQSALILHTTTPAPTSLLSSLFVLGWVLGVLIAMQRCQCFCPGDTSCGACEPAAGFGEVGAADANGRRRESRMRGR